MSTKKHPVIACIRISIPIGENAFFLSRIIRHNSIRFNDFEDSAAKQSNRRGTERETMIFREVSRLATRERIRIHHLNL